VACLGCRDGQAQSQCLCDPSDGSGLKQLTFDHTSGAPSWTSDGKILFANIDDTHAVN
jgi:hypothetical protein